MRVAAGVAACICQNAMSNIGLTLQRYANVEAAAPSRKGEEETVRATAVMWWIGLVVYLVSQPLNVVALTLAPECIIAPLGSVEILINTVTATMVLGESLSVADVCGVCLFVGGSAMVVVFGPTAEEDFRLRDLFSFGSRPEYFSFVLCSAGLALGCCAMLFWASTTSGDSRATTVRAVCFPLLFGIVTAFNQMFVKACGMVVGGGFQAFHREPVEVAIVLMTVVVLSISSIRVLSSALHYLENRVFVPAQFVLQAMFMELQGAIFFREFSYMPLLNRVCFMIGCAICVATVFLISVANAAEGQVDAGKEVLIAHRLSKTLEPVERRLDGAQLAAIRHGVTGLTPRDTVGLPYSSVPDGDSSGSRT
mmetsp:Transcript_16741/g.37050  ORF Transcript_16741/g.37050 Transcript_16741/m.37050 type:complete len:366 (-) Transcript_16741:42-1139(-)